MRGYCSMIHHFLVRLAPSSVWQKKLFLFNTTVLQLLQYGKFPSKFDPAQTNRHCPCQTPRQRQFIPRGILASQHCTDSLPLPYQSTLILVIIAKRKSKSFFFSNLSYPPSPCKYIPLWFFFSGKRIYIAESRLAIGHKNADRIHPFSLPLPLYSCLHVNCTAGGQKKTSRAHTSSVVMRRSAGTNSDQGRVMIPCVLLQKTLQCIGPPASGC